MYDLQRMDGLLQQFLQQKVQQSLLRRRGKRLLKPIKPLHTKSLERQYFKEIQPIVHKLQELTKQNLFPQLEPLLIEARALRPIQDSIRIDRYAEQLEQILNLLKIQFLREHPEEKILQIAQTMAERVDRFNLEQINKYFRRVFGSDYSRYEPWLTQEIKGFMKMNVKLITSIPEDYFNKVEGIVLRGAQSGKLAEEITPEIQDQFDITENRAQLIARDQVSKFNGNLTQLRQQSAGIERYTWSTSGDERVRPEHDRRERQVFSWNDPPEDGHPGQAIQCRCVAIPVFKEGSQEEE